MNQAEYLCHSSGPWKKHKYFQKIGEGANAVYKYAKDKGEKAKSSADKFYDRSITGEYYKSGVREADKNQQEELNKRNELVKQEWEETREGLKAGAKYTRSLIKEKDDNIAMYGRRKQQAQENYENKSLFGKTEKAAKVAKETVAKGEKILKEFFTPKVTETVTNVSTGKKRTPSHSGTTINIKTGKVTRR